MQEIVSEHPEPEASGRILPWAGVLLAGLALALVGQFWLDGFADSSLIGHWTQHATLFGAGGLAGAALVRLYQLGRHAA